ncbi:hypothetical protein [Aurantimonas sp. 22II-16-19i]|uniref:hypothetical protein n=1 Tax=Aurantimonas sp. 22II-16-19i TaxID=1317114 RepID=UPI00111C82F4|nr:hypothetical protein [Aurantimonas sp. 22II-16-19i]
MAAFAKIGCSERMYGLRHAMSQTRCRPASETSTCIAERNRNPKKIAAMIRSCFRNEAAQTVAVTGLLSAALLLTVGFLQLVA